MPHTNYRPITLPSPEVAAAHANTSTSQIGSKSQSRVIGTRNASVPATILGPYQAPGKDKREPKRNDLSAAADAQDADRTLPQNASPGEDIQVDPSDPSWISPADFVEFILAHESLTEEFCYMNRSGPYEFEIVPFSKINPNDYMTISIRGVTHYANGELEYQDLADWQRDQEMYRKITAKKFFRMYQKWKLFSVWKSAMRNQRLQKCSRHLNQHLFALDPTLCMSLLRCRTECVKITMFNLLEVNPVSTYPLEEFEQAQVKRRVEVAQELHQVWNKIKNELHQSCTVSLQNFLQANGFGQKAQEKDETKSEDAREGNERDEEAGGGMTYTERATTRTQCRKLTKFIRVVQYLFNDAITEMVKNSTASLLAVFDAFAEDVDDATEPETPAVGGPSIQAVDHGKRNHQRPTFIVECLLRFNSLSFSPSGEAIRECIEACLHEAMRATCGEQAFLQCDDFLTFTEPLAELGDAPQLEDQQSDLYGLVNQDPQFRNLMQKIKGRYDELFERVTTYVDSFQQFVVIYNENQALQDCSVAFADASLDVFRDSLAKYRQQTEDVKAMARTKDIGLFRLDNKRLQDELLPSPKRCSDFLSKYIPELAMQKQVVLSTELKAANERLEKYPSNVDEFVDFNLHLAKIDEDMPDIERRNLEVQELQEIILTYKIKLEPDARKAFNELAAAMKQLVLQVNSGKERSESNQAHFSRQLEEDIPALNARVEEQLKGLSNPIFSDTTKMDKESRQEVLRILDSMEQDVQTSKEDSVRYNRYQDVLRMDPTSFDGVEQLKEDFGTIAKMWRGIDQWEDLSNTWNETPFGVVEVESIQQQVMAYNELALKSLKGLPDSNVPQTWGDQVSTFKNTLPVVVALRNEALQARHHTEITKLIGQDVEAFVKDEEFTLGDLLKMGVDQHMGPIIDISNNATAEKALEEMLKQVRDTWLEMELQVIPYKEFKDIFILGSVEEITVALKESLVTVSTLAGSRYVAPIRDEVEQWQKDLLLFQETLDEWLNVQKNWMYLESIFSSPDIKKALPSESGKFAEIDKQWKTIMHDANSYSVAFKQATRPGRLQLFKDAVETLDNIQKQLDDYLLSKGISFERSFFLENDEFTIRKALRARLRERSEHAGDVKQTG